MRRLLDATTSTRYDCMPDKESPLWDLHSQVICRWTATEVNDRGALIIVYNGKVWPRPKRGIGGILGFERRRMVERSCAVSPGASAEPEVGSLSQ